MERNPGPVSPLPDGCGPGGGYCFGRPAWTGGGGGGEGLGQCAGEGFCRSGDIGGGGGQEISERHRPLYRRYGGPLRQTALGSTRERAVADVGRLINYAAGYEADRKNTRLK